MRHACNVSHWLANQKSCEKCFFSQENISKHMDFGIGCRPANPAI